MADPETLVEEKDPLVLKVVYLVLFYVVLRLCGIIVTALTVVQTVYVLLGGAPQPDLTRFSTQLSLYLQQLTAYMTWARAEKPYPFAEWPRPLVAVTDDDA